MADGHLRASAIIGAGTLASRITGLVRSVVLVLVLGSYASAPAAAFTNANALPTNFYELLAAGVITGIIVPQIVKAANHADGGSRFVSKLLTLGTVLMLGATVVAMAIAPVLVWIYAPGFSAEQRALFLAFAYWCLPQLFFYGLYALVGEALNARRVFGPYSWAPTVNNIVSIAGFGVFLAVYGGPLTEVGDWDAARIALLAGTATLGIAAQSFILLFFWRRTGLTYRPDFRWRGMGLRSLGRLAWWTFLTVVVGQLAGIVQIAVLSNASESTNYSVYTYAWLIFMLPHSIVAMSISTSYFTSLSELVAEGRHSEVEANLDESVRALSFFAFGSAAAIAAASVPLTRVFTTTVEGAVAMAGVLLAFIIALVPFGILVIVRRAFFAFADTRTPFWFSLVQYAISVAGALGALGLWIAGILPLAWLAAAVALSQSIATFVQLPVAIRMLRRHTGPLAVGRTARALARFGLAAIPALAAGVGVFLLGGGIGGWMTSSMLLGAAGGALVGSVSLVVYVAVLALLRAPELAVVGRLVARFRRS